MIELPKAIKESIRENKPIEMDGLTFFPILVREMDEYNEARPAIEFMQQTLPVRYAVMPLLAAFHALDYDAMQETGETTGIFYRAILFLCLSLRLGRGKPARERARLITPVFAQDDFSKLIALSFNVNGEEHAQITPAQFTKWRPILAAQNGLAIPDETANKELIEAKMDIENTHTMNILPDLDAQISSMAHSEHCDEAELMEWPIRKFNARYKAIDRELRFVICALAEANGAKWKGGNPYPSWCFDRAEGNPALISMSEFMSGPGGAAIQKSSQ